MGEDICKKHEKWLKCVKYIKILKINKKTSKEPPNRKRGQ